MKNKSKIHLPTEEQVYEKFKKGEQLSALDIFIRNHQPRDEQEAVTFREQLESVLNEISG